LLRIRTFLVAAALGALVMAGSSGAVVPKLSGAVGPGFTITLKRGPLAVRTLKPGRYTITVSDRSSIHNFHLKGPGLNREITTVGFVGTKSITVTLRKGRYTFVCDPHFTSMKGSFTVT
jgi:plastocyanin